MSRACTLIEQWLKNRDTVLFLGIWEQINNTDFNSLEFEGIKDGFPQNTEWVNIRLDEQDLQDVASHLYHVNPVHPVHLFSKCDSIFDDISLNSGVAHKMLKINSFCET